jgi:WD40 repeat protein
MKTPRLLKAYSMPVDASVFSGVPSVTALKPLPSQNVLLAAAMDRRVVCLDLKATPEGVKRIPGKHLDWAHDNWVHSLDVHADSERVATGGMDRRIKVWKWDEKKPLFEWEAREWVRAVAFSRDGKMLASTGDDGRVCLWALDVGKLIATLEPGGSFLDTLAWVPDGKRLFGSGNDGKVHVWSVEGRRLERSTDVDNRRLIEDEPLNGGFSYPGGIRRMTCSPDGKRIAAVGLTSLVVLDSATGKVVLNQPGRGFGVAFDPSGNRLAFSREKDLLIWDFTVGGVSHTIRTDQLGLFGMCFLDGGKQFVSGGCNGWAGVWEIA